ncbi:hypothetical protein SALBM311S_01786 [Streptomyces alboniger]
MSSDTLAKAPAAPDIPEPAESLRIVPQRRFGQWTAAVAVLVLLALAVNSVLRNEAFQWDVVADYFTSDAVLRGLWLTLWLTGDRRAHLRRPADPRGAYPRLGARAGGGLPAAGRHRPPPSAPGAARRRTGRGTPAGVLGWRAALIRSTPTSSSSPSVTSTPNWDDQQSELAAYAGAHGLVHLPPDFTADSDLSPLAPGEPVLVRGFGLAFVDLMVLLTEGRGGRYDKDTYVPSGREPVLYVGSRRGVPYHSKIGYDWTGERPPLPRFFGPAEVNGLLARPGGFDFRRDVWPLVEKELGFAHYHRLFTVHPERTGVAWSVFEEKYAAVDDPAGRAALVAAAVPDPADRLDLAALDRPLEGTRYDSLEAFQDGLRGYVERDLGRRHDPAHSPDLAVFLGLLSVYGQLVKLGDVGPWWHGFFSYLASGPPGPRLRQLLALSRAGVLKFLGADMTVAAEGGVFRASSATVPGFSVEARALVEARLPEPTVARARDPLLRALHAEGAAETPDGLLRVDPADGRLLDRAGGPHPRRFALGPYTDGRTPGAFTRPRTGGPAFRQNDATARAALTYLTALSGRAAA